MTKHLRAIVEKVSEGKDTKLKGVKSSKMSKLDISDLNDSPGNQKFAADHSREDHADRVGNGDEDYKGKTKQIPGDRHGNNTKEKSKAAYAKMNEKACDYEDEPMQPKDRPKKGQKVLLGGKKGLEERKLSASEKKKKEKYVKSMKGADWEERYPGKGEEVMYATATKLAKKKE